MIKNQSLYFYTYFPQYKQRRLNEVWIAWRKEFIKRKVVDTMMKQDRRKLLSDVSGIFPFEKSFFIFFSQVFDLVSLEEDFKYPCLFIL